MKKTFTLAATAALAASPHYSLGSSGAHIHPQRSAQTVPPRGEIPAKPKPPQDRTLQKMRPSTAGPNWTLSGTHDMEKSRAELYAFVELKNATAMSTSQRPTFVLHNSTGARQYYALSAPPADWTVYPLEKETTVVMPIGGVLRLQQRGDSGQLETDDYSVTAGERYFIDIVRNRVGLYRLKN